MQIQYELPKQKVKANIWKLYMIFETNKELMENLSLQTETMHGTLRLFPVFISPIAWNMCEHLHYESVYFKELHMEQEYYIQCRDSWSVNYY